MDRHADRGHCQYKYSLLMHCIKIESLTKFIFDWLTSIHFTRANRNCELESTQTANVGTT